MFLLVDCDRPTDGRTDTTEYRDARTHLKITKGEQKKGLQGINKRTGGKTSDAHFEWRSAECVR